MDTLDQIEKLLPSNSINLDHSNNSIVVQGINDSTINITSLDDAELDKLRQNILEDNRELFDKLIKKAIISLHLERRTRIRFFQTIGRLKTSTQTHKFIFSNQLAYFTPEEIDSHQLIVDHIQSSQTALLLGFPATGKSFAVVDIAERLALQGFQTLYFSFKKLDRWPELLEEILDHASPQTVFVLDDVHLQSDKAGDALNELEHDDKLNILFISREVYANRGFEDTRNIYQDLESLTVRTESPSIDEKVEGIVKLYKEYYEWKNQRDYAIGDITQVVKNTHRNLIVLQSYLNLWEKFSFTPLGKLNEEELYKDVYQRYFEQSQIDEDKRVALLQYLCIYYFEIFFFKNPDYRPQTNFLIEKSILVKEENDFHSIYHGEFAFLLLKAFRYVKGRWFKQLGDNWEDFFSFQLKKYLLSFKDSSLLGFPENLIEFLVSIPRFSKEVEGGITDTDKIFRALLADESIQAQVFQALKIEDGEKYLSYLFSSIARNLPEKFSFFYTSSLEKLQKSPYSLSIYCNAYIELPGEELKESIKEFSTPYISDFIRNSPILQLGESLHRLFKFYPHDARFLFSLCSIDHLLLKARNEKISILGTSLNKLSQLDLQKAKNTYKSIDLESFPRIIDNVRLNELGQALVDLGRIDPSQSKKIYDAIEEEKIDHMIKEASLNQLGLSLNLLKKINQHKTSICFLNLALDTLVTKANEEVKLSILANSLNHLNKIDSRKTRKILWKIRYSRWEKLISKAKVHELGFAIGAFKIIDQKKTRLILETIEENDLLKKVKESKLSQACRLIVEINQIDTDKTRVILANTTFNDFKKMTLAESTIGQLSAGLYQLYKIDPQLAKITFDSIYIDDLIRRLEEIDFSEFGLILNKFKRIDFFKTKIIFDGISFEKLLGQAKEEGIQELGNSLNLLKNINNKKTKALFEEISLTEFQTRISSSSLKEMGNALNQFYTISPSKSKTIYASIEIYFLTNNFHKTSFQEAGHILRQLKKIDLTKTQELLASLDLPDLVTMGLNEKKISGISDGLHGIQQIDPNKASKIFEMLDFEALAVLIRKENQIFTLVSSLTILHTVDQYKTNLLYQTININTFSKRLGGAKISTLSNALEQLNKINHIRTKSLLQTFEIKELAKMAERQKTIKPLNKSFAQLMVIDLERTKNVFECMEEESLRMMVEKTKIQVLGRALKALSLISFKKTQVIIDQSQDYILSFTNGQENKDQKMIQSIGMISTISKDLRSKLETSSFFNSTKRK